MAASSAALAALEAHLMRADYKKAFVLLEDVRTFLLRCYPSLEVKLVRVSDVEGDSKWVVVCCEKYSRVEGNPVKPARLVFVEDGTYCFEVLLKKVKVGSWIDSLPPHREICDYLDTFLENSGYLICLVLSIFRPSFAKQFDSNQSMYVCVNTVYMCVLISLFYFILTQIAILIQNGW